MALSRRRYTQQARRGFVMLPSAHFFSGVAIFVLMSTFNLLAKNFLFFSLIVICSMIPDVDIIVSTLHRNEFSHTPVFWLSIATAIVVIKPSAWFIFPPLLTHLSLDTLDYGLMVLYPFSRRKYGLALLGRDIAKESKPLSSYLREYLCNHKLVCVELGIMFSSLLLLIGYSPLR
jgi:hypothetical protein